VTPPADWGVRFQELAADASQMSARALRRYQELLDRVASGELKPEQIQRQFAAYMQQQATPATRDLVEMSLGLLTGLLYAEARYREALLDGLLPATEPVPPPPSPADVDLAHWFQALSTYATAQAARAMSRHQLLVDRVAAGEISAADVQNRSRRYLEEQAPEFVNDVMRLGLAFVAGLQRSSSTFTDTLYDQVLGPDMGSTSAPEPPVCVDLRGAPGSVVSANLVVENTHGRGATVVCRASEFAARAFGRRFRAALEIVPSEFALGPGGQQEVELRLPLDPSLFAEGADYVATLQIAGASEREVIVQLLARAELADPPAQHASS
jgi:hypothetical protein